MALGHAAIGGSAMAMSNTSKTGLALGALLPVLASLYSEYDKQNQVREQQQAARAELLKKQRGEAVVRDLDTAQKLLIQIATQDQKSLCEQFYIASELVRLGTYSKATRHALLSALRYQPEQGESARPRICDCPNTLEQMRVSWRPGLDNTASAAVISEMAGGLDDAAGLCPPPGQETAAADKKLPIGPESPAMSAPPPPAEVPIPGPLPRPEAPAAVAPAAPAPALDVAADQLRACNQADPPPVSTVRVYLQIADESQRPLAQRLQQRLVSLGYAVPGIERVGTRAPAKAQLRYVYAEDRAEALRLQHNAGRRPAGGDCEPVFDLRPPMAQYRLKTPQNSFELWFPNPAASATGSGS